ncbi:hypothetical protein [Frankia nepalensis]|uniref:Uncharacterized protein n=1 Tax=Frankia nepalensis TaxID=1836974 RepID=A0A937ULY5_9ACTN|nr:hypothetical protein [Frankia nepalensis]MBL7509518.1 hypothetical protein [Frankia nepalensis]MBL7626282.1 hypothetical protein [Frankia nepalensis]
MKLVRLAAGGADRVLAVVRLASGEVVDVVFTVTSAFLSGSDPKLISVANPEPYVFGRESMSAHDVHVIVAAVLAFAHVAAEPGVDTQGEREESGPDAVGDR